MGTVYKAVDPVIERAVAIKTINLNLSKEERAEFEERFYREAKSAGRLSHANIVTIYDVGEIDDVAYIAMEYLEGESLREMLDSGLVLPIELIGRIAARIANGLNYAHENQVVHRDIKPANIMITPSRDVKIMDFGIAQVPTGSRTQVGTVLGSPKYMAPEQVVGKSTDGKTDIFALGVVLYEMLTGVTPFNGDNLSAIMYKILHEEPVPPSTINPRIPAKFDRIVSRALSKRPEDRYQTALEFARDLGNHEAALPQEAPRPVAGSEPAKPIRARTPAGEQDATVFLPPNRAHELKPSPAGKGEPARGKSTSLLTKAHQHRKSLFLLAVPLLIAAAFVIYSQSPQPDSAQVAVQETAPLVEMPVTEPPSGVPEAQPPMEIPGNTAPPAETPAIAAAPAARDPKVSPASEVSAPENAPAPVSATPAKASVMFAVTPWGEVFVDGKSVGVSPPLTSLQLDAGKHNVEIRNQQFAPYRGTVNLKSGESLKIKHKFK
ncbi:MAG: eukaryotic-like serine/threonine-protein kinase [Pseudomonadota bacterium]|nr:eukaryotic-like serine/threonine-protein kinase [Pseudomonadota bacterium]